eukprot:TRINITY_DN16014_c0_g1_i3.p1 TRINITY_DN16014_c0_g1~~TRINITY_DN16014_c0_g1_i3.p1  ORF type:complete len:640 (+),score=136.06 TRINITY_DN16014_c0_g1_i3:130-2049(+)
MARASLAPPEEAPERCRGSANAGETTAAAEKAGKAAGAVGMAKARPSPSGGLFAPDADDSSDENEYDEEEDMEIVAAELSAETEAHFVERQAILAGMPMHAVPQGVRTCSSSDILIACSGAQRRPTTALVEEHLCRARLQSALNTAADKYEDHESALKRLDVVFASIDFVCFADHRHKRLYTAARGTDRAVNPLTFPRDWNSNFSILMGYGPKRHIEAANDYRVVRSALPEYKSFGSGHSLGGAVMLHLAMDVESDPGLCFERVDVFNTAWSPIAKPDLGLSQTDVHIHRTEGDFASWGAQGCPFQLHTVEGKAHIFGKHTLQHFLPEPRPRSSRNGPANAGGSAGAPGQGSWLGQALRSFSFLNCVGARSKGTNNGSNGRHGMTNGEFDGCSTAADVADGAAFLPAPPALAEESSAADASAAPSRGPSQANDSATAGAHAGVDASADTTCPGADASAGVGVSVEGGSSRSRARGAEDAPAGMADGSGRDSSPGDADQAVRAGVEAAAIAANGVDGAAPAEEGAAGAAPDVPAPSSALPPPTSSASSPPSAEEGAKGSKLPVQALTVESSSANTNAIVEASDKVDEKGEDLACGTASSVQTAADSTEVGVAALALSSSDDSVRNSDLFADSPADGSQSR